MRGVIQYSGSLAQSNGDNTMGVSEIYDLAGGFDIFLSGHEHEDVPRGKGQVDGQCLLHGCVHVVFTGSLKEGD